MPERRSIIPQAVVFELALGLLGGLLALGTGQPLHDRMIVSSIALARGAAACVPMLAMLAIAATSNWPPLARLRRRVEEMVNTLFRGASLLDLAAISAAAGLGEEILFRGALQPLFVGWTTPWGGLVTAGVLFGVLHAASTAYFVLATAVGLYLGWLAQHYNDLVAPIFAHAVYDFVALWLLRRRTGRTTRAED